MEFKFTDGSLEAAGLVEEDELKCTYSDSPAFKTGDAYYVYALFDGLMLMDDDGEEASHCEYLVKFKPIKEEQPYIDPEVAIQRLESVMEYVNKKLDFLNSNGVQSFQLDEVKRLMNGE